jgi:hypothetical protein
VYELPSLPPTVTLVALVADTVRFAELPAAMEMGFAERLTVVAAVTVTVAVAVTVPPDPFAVAVYVVVVVGLTETLPPEALRL